jgi:membrane associated rhomboid family serine protease
VSEGALFYDAWRCGALIPSLSGVDPSTPLSGLSSTLLRGTLGEAQWWRLFTAPLLHRDLGHLLSNLCSGGVALWLIMRVHRARSPRPSTTDISCSSPLFLTIYVHLCAVIGFAMRVALGAPEWSMGLSGGIFSLYGLWLGWGWTALKASPPSQPEAIRTRQLIRPRRSLPAPLVATLLVWWAFWGGGASGDALSHGVGLGLGLGLSLIDRWIESTKRNGMLCVSVALIYLLGATYGGFQSLAPQSSESNSSVGSPSAHPLMSSWYFVPFIDELNGPGWTNGVISVGALLLNGAEEGGELIELWGPLLERVDELSNDSSETSQIRLNDSSETSSDPSKLSLCVYRGPRGRVIEVTRWIDDYRALSLAQIEWVSAEGAGRVKLGPLRGVLRLDGGRKDTLHRLTSEGQLGVQCDVQKILNIIF